MSLNYGEWGGGVGPKTISSGHGARKILAKFPEVARSLSVQLGYINLVSGE